MLEFVGNCNHILNWNEIINEVKDQEGKKGEKFRHLKWNSNVNSLLKASIT